LQSQLRIHVPRQSARAKKSRSRLAPGASSVRRTSICTLAKSSSVLRRTTQQRRPSSCGSCTLWSRRRQPMPSRSSGSC
jgi:hypothetical protein